MEVAGRTAVRSRGTTSVRQGAEPLAAQTPSPRLRVRRTPTVVVVVESEPLYRVGLVAALQGRGGLEVLAAEQVEDWRSGRIPVDVAVVSANPPECEDLEVVGQVAESSLHTRVLVLGTRDELTVTRALAAGAVGIFVKDSSGDTVCEAIEQIAGGESAFSPSCSGWSPGSCGRSSSARASS